MKYKLVIIKPFYGTQTTEYDAKKFLKVFPSGILAKEKVVFEPKDANFIMESGITMSGFPYMLIKII